MRQRKSHGPVVLGDPIEIAKTHEHALFAVHPRSNYPVGPMSRTVKFMAYYTPRVIGDYIATRFSFRFPLPDALKKKK